MPPMDFMFKCMPTIQKRMRQRLTMLLLQKASLPLLVPGWRRRAKAVGTKKLAASSSNKAAVIGVLISLLLNAGEGLLSLRACFG